MVALDFDAVILAQENGPEACVGLVDSNRKARQLTTLAGLVGEAPGYKASPPLRRTVAVPGCIEHEITAEPTASDTQDGNFRIHIAILT